MDDLIRDIQERTGLPADKVLEVVTMVTDYLKQVLPADLVSQITSYVGAAAETAGGAAGKAQSAGTSAAEGASSVVAKAAGVAASAFSVARDALTDAASTDDE